jgi:hypothetical protein
MKWLVLVVVAGCRQPASEFVRSAEIAGRELRVVKCPVGGNGEHVTVSELGCRTLIYRLPPPRVAP